jgi:hypothetical protein
MVKIDNCFNAKVHETDVYIVSFILVLVQEIDCNNCNMFCDKCIWNLL